MNASSSGFTYRRVIATVASALIVMAVSWSVASGQVATATVQGTVTDDTKSVLPGVTVTAVSEQTGQVRAVVTDERGFYRIPALPPGRYTLTAELAGFAAVKRTGLTLTIGQELEIPFQLGVVALQETVTVTSEAPLIETSKTTLGTTFTQQKLEVLPIAGRNYLTLVTMATGVTPEGGAAGMASAGPQLGPRRLSGRRRQPGEQPHARIARQPLARFGAGVPGPHQHVRRGVRHRVRPDRQHPHAIGHQRACSGRVGFYTPHERARCARLFCARRGAVQPAVVQRVHSAARFVRNKLALLRVVRRACDRIKPRW